MNESIECYSVIFTREVYVAADSEDDAIEQAFEKMGPNPWDEFDIKVVPDSDTFK